MSWVTIASCFLWISLPLLTNVFSMVTYILSCKAWGIVDHVYGLLLLSPVVPITLSLTYSALEEVVLVCPRTLEFWFLLVKADR